MKAGMFERTSESTLAIASKNNATVIAVHTELMELKNTFDVINARAEQASPEPSPPSKPAAAS